MTDEKSIADRLYPTMPRSQEQHIAKDAGQMVQGKYDALYPSLRPENKGKEMRDEGYEDVYKKAARERKQAGEADENKEAHNLADRIAKRLNLQQDKQEAPKQEQAAEAGETNVTWEEVGAQWKTEADKEFADVELSPARDVLREHGDEELMELIDSLQLGNHPAVIRFMMNLASKEK